MFSKPPTRALILSANGWEERMARAMGAQPLRKGEHPMRPRGLTAACGGADNRADGIAGKLCHFAKWP
jgi:hypothetical protein